MTDSEIDEALGATGELFPIWLAVVELLQQGVDEAVEGASTHGLPDHLRQFHGGRLNQALLTRNTFMERMTRVKAPGPTVE